MERIIELRQEGQTIKQVAARLNDGGLPYAAIAQGIYEHVGAEALCLVAS